MNQKESYEFSLSGDFDGRTVAELIEMLQNYPKDAVVDVRTEKVYGYGGWTNEDREFFVFKWME